MSDRDTATEGVAQISMPAALSVIRMELKGKVKDACLPAAAVSVKASRFSKRMEERTESSDKRTYKSTSKSKKRGADKQRYG